MQEHDEQRRRRPRPDWLFVAVMGLAIAVGALSVDRGQREETELPPLLPEPAEAPATAAPETAVDEPLPDFSAFDDARQKKQAFFDYLQPLVEQHNQRLLAEREQVAALAAKLEEGHALSELERDSLAEFAHRYRIELKPGREKQAVAALLRRVDIVPVSLALIQSANESGWGTSRFAREANNLFGQKCFREGCGIAPGRRQGGPEYARFDAPADAVASYMHNLNTNPAYLDFRKLREQLREQEQPVTGPAVADGLHRYSVRGDDYVRELRSMILRDRLHRIDETVAEAEMREEANVQRESRDERLRVAGCGNGNQLRC